MEEQDKTINNDTIPKPENACETLEEVIRSRRKYRSLLFHILYAADAYNYETSAQEIAEKFNEEYDTDIPSDSSMITTVSSIGENLEQLDNIIIPLLEKWKFERLGKCTVLVLRYAIWEMIYTDMSHNIIINEAIELSKCFSEKDAYKFINGILDKASTQFKEKNTIEEQEEATAEEQQEDLSEKDKNQEA